MKTNMLLDEIRKASTIALGGHERPDGDCVGSSMGLYLYIKENFPEKEVSVYLEDIPFTFRFMKCSEEIRHEATKGKEYDLFVMLDCGEAERLGFAGCVYENAKKTFCVDHHVSNKGLADVNYIRHEASSTSELVFELLDCERISKSSAECLYTGIVHDTGVFRYSCTAPSTMRAAACLMEKGIDSTGIISKSFDEKTFVQNQMLGKALLKSTMVLGNRCIMSFITGEEMDAYQVQPKHLDGIVSQLKLTKGAEVAIFMYELSDGVYKVSMRASESVDVSLVAQYFEGGGHKRAAGFTKKGTVEEIMDALAPQLEKQMKNRSGSRCCMAF